MADIIGLATLCWSKELARADIIGLATLRWSKELAIADIIGLAALYVGLKSLPWQTS